MKRPKLKKSHSLLNMRRGEGARSSGLVIGLKNLMKGAARKVIGKKNVASHPEGPHVMPRSRGMGIDVNMSVGASREKEIDAILKEKTHERKNQLYLENYLREKEKINQTLQVLVQENYEKFIDTSKEIEHFLEEIMEVNNNLNTLKETISSLYKSMEKGMKGKTVMETKYDGIDKFRIRNELNDKFLEFESQICQNEFGKAIDSYRDLNAVELDNEFDLRFEEQKSLLKKKLIQRIYSQVSRKEEVNNCIGYLGVLTSGMVARHTFLKCRAHKINSRIRTVYLAGDLLSYIRSISYIKFQSLLDTKEEFLKLFKNESDISAFIQWVLHEIEDFIGIFKVQVLSSDSLALISECVRCIMENSENLEKDGICIAFRLEQLIMDDLVRVIFEFSQKWKENELVTALKNDRFKVLSFYYRSLDQKNLNMSSSCDLLFRLLIDFSNNVENMTSKSLCSSFINTVEDIIDFYLQGLAKFIKENDYVEDRQHFTIVCNVMALQNVLLPWMMEKLSRHYKRNLPEIESLMSKVCDVEGILKGKFLSTKARFLYDKLNFSSEKYPVIADIENDIVTPALVNLVGDYFPKLVYDLHASQLPKKGKKYFILGILNSIIHMLVNDAKFVAKPKDFNNFQMNHVILDLEFLKQLAIQLKMKEENKKKINKLIERLLGAKEFLLQEGAWFLGKLNKTMNCDKLKNALYLLKEIVEEKKEVEEEEDNDDDEDNEDEDEDEGEEEEGEDNDEFDDELSDEDDDDE